MTLISLFFALFGLLSASASKAAEVAPRFVPEQCFPSSIPGFETDEIPAEQRASLRAHRNTTVAGYKAEPFHFLVTVYVYDRNPGADESQETIAVTSAILASHPGSRLAKQGKGNIPLSGVATEATTGLFTLPQGIWAYGSIFWLVTTPKHHLKFRATYDREPGKEVEAVTFAMQSIRTIAESICTPD